MRRANLLNCIRVIFHLRASFSKGHCTETRIHFNAVFTLMVMILLSKQNIWVDTFEWLINNENGVVLEDLTCVRNVFRFSRTVVGIKRIPRALIVYIIKTELSVYLNVAKVDRVWRTCENCYCTFVYNNKTQRLFAAKSYFYARMI